ncbi:MAG TPA: DUF6640 family protein [Gemmatirosa sp.]
MEVAKWLVAVVALYNFGGVVADAVVPSGARMHLRNPNWPPHAKFHNGQSMTMGLCLGLLSLVVLFAPGPLTRPRLALAAATAAVYFVAMLLAPLYPGTAWVDPEFNAEVHRPLGLPPQQVVAGVLCALLAAALALTFLR